MAKNNFVAQLPLIWKWKKKIFLVFVLQKFHIKPQVLVFGG